MARSKTEGERYTRVLENRIRKLSSIHELVREIAVEEFSKIKHRRSPAKPRKRARGGKYEAILVLSDFQAGKKTASYDSDVFRRRLASLASPTRDLAELWGIETLHVFCLGDLVEGSVIYPGQAWHLDSPAFIQACRTVPEAIYNLIHDLLPSFRKVTVTDVPGNHGRAGPNRAGIPERDNFDSVAIAVLEALLKPEIDAKRIDFRACEDPNWWNHREVLGHGCLLVHGNQLSPTTHKLKQAMLGWHAAPEIPDFRFLLLGHWHQRTIVSVNGLEARISPSLDSDCQFAMEKLQATSEPAQMLYVMHRKHGIVGEHELKVDRL